MAVTMRGIAIVLAGLLAACQPNVEQEIAELRVQIARQQAELERLSAFVDSQAAVLTVCEETIASFMNYVVNSSTLGMLREASTQIDNVSQCTDALARLREAAETARSQ